MDFEKNWIKSASKLKASIVLPEAEFSSRVLEAGVKSAEMGLCEIVLLTKKSDLKEYSNMKNIRVVNILNHDITPIVANAYFVKRQHKGVTPDQAKIDVQDPYLFGAMMVDLGLVDGMVGGAEAPSAKIFSSAFKTIKAKDGKKASSFFVFLPTRKDQKLYVVADGGVVLNPTSEELADITIDTVNSYRKLIGKEPKVALLSYSTKGSAGGESAEKVVETCNILKQRKVDFTFDGELQLDAAIVPEVAKLKCPKSPVKGSADILIFPDLQSGNIGYKLIQRFGGYKAIGPLIQGLNAPTNDLSRGATVEEIIVSIAITILQK